MESDLFLALLFPLLPGILIGVDKSVGFRRATDHGGYAFSYSGSVVRHRTP